MCDLQTSTLRRPRSELGCVWLGLIHILTFNFSTVLPCSCSYVRIDVIHKDNIPFHKEKSNEKQQCYQNFIIPYLYEAEHISGDIPPIIRSLKLHWQPLVFHTWKVVGHVQQPSTYEKPEAASAVLGS